MTAAFYIHPELDGGVATDAAFVTFHPAADPRPGASAVLLCPPKGWEEVCSYRSLREWALALSRAGYPTLRLTYPSTGDSAGTPRDPDRLAAWERSVAVAARWLRIETRASRVVGIGLELGGLLLHRAAAAGADVDDLVVWGTPASGKALVRQWRTFSRLESSLFYEDLPAPPPVREDDIEAGGFLVSAETRRALEGVDLSATSLPSPERRHVLLLERDGIAVDAALRQSLEVAGADVRVAAGDGYGGMTSHPQQSRPPRAVLETVENWLRSTDVEPDRPAPTSTAASRRPRTTASLRLQDEDGCVTETPVEIEVSGVHLSGILVEPGQHPGILAALLLNAGAVRRIGPNRMWVQQARRWAALGLPVLRLDVEGIGDSDGDVCPYGHDDSLHTETLLAQVFAAMDDLQARSGAQRFIVGGLCSGAYWSLQALLRDRRVALALLVNPRFFVFDADLAPARYVRTLITRRPSPARILEIATPSMVAEVVRWLLGAPRRWLRRAVASSGVGRSGAGADIGAVTEQLVGADARAVLLFSHHEPLHEDLRLNGGLARLEAAPNVTMGYIPVFDHTLRPGWAQSAAQAALDGAVNDEMVRAGKLRQGMTAVAIAGSAGPGTAARQAVDEDGPDG